MFTLVYAGALVPEKGVDVAIEAVARCATAQLLVTGAGPEEAALRALAARVAPERVVFAAPETGPVAAYAAADAIVLASRGGDSMPAVLIEAGLMELPAIATPIEAIPEIVLPGITGELVPVGDVDALRAGDRQRSRPIPIVVHALGHAARSHCLEHYSIEPIAAAWERVLREVVFELSVRGGEARARPRAVSRARLRRTRTLPPQCGTAQSRAALSNRTSHVRWRARAHVRRRRGERGGTDRRGAGELHREVVDVAGL